MGFLRLFLLTFALLIGACGAPIKGKVLSTRDIGIYDPTTLGLPKNFPLDPPPNQLVVSPSPIVFGTSLIGVAVQEDLIFMNSYKKDITLVNVQFRNGTDMIILGGTCATLPGDVLAAGDYCALAVQFIPTAAVTRNDNLDVDFDDGAAKTLSVPVSGTGH